MPTIRPRRSPSGIRSDATPLNGCIYVLPAHVDERFHQRRWDGEGNNVVRALPATAGSRLGVAPRISAAFEFQRGDRAPFNRPLLDPGPLPPFTERLGLIGKQVLQYRHMYPLTDDVAAVATSLFERFMPRVALPIRALDSPKASSPSKSCR